MQKCAKCGVLATSPAIKCPRCFSTGTLVAYDPVQKSLPESQEAKESKRYATGFENLDHLLNGGMVTGCIHFLATAPGIGKTTMLSQIAAYQQKQGRKVYYFTGEEAPNVVTERARRLGILQFQPELFFGKDFRELCEIIRKMPPDIIILDSLQALFNSQTHNLTREAIASVMLQMRKLTEKYSLCTWIIGQVRKDLKFLGPQALSHYSDVMMEAHKGINDEVILTTPDKNRFGSIGNRAVFRMTEAGLQEKNEVETGFILRHNNSSTLGLGTFVAETLYGFTVDEVTTIENDKKKLILVGGASAHAELLINIIQFYFHDFQPFYTVRANLSEKITKSADLAIVMALLSQYYNKPLPRDSVFIASLDASGRLLQVPNVSEMVKRAKAQGYNRIFGALPVGSQVATWETAGTIMDVWEKINF